jgi:hypothetical protein
MTVLHIKNIIAILKFLSTVNCHPDLEMPVVFADDLEYPGFYHDHVIYLKPDAQDRVVVHELYHSCQVAPKDEADWFAKEKKAQYIELLWLEWKL